jgi:putative Holliday junction resolvase
VPKPPRQPTDDQPGQESDIPASGRLGGVDYGTVRLGVALTDPERIIASPFANYDRKTDELDSLYFRQLVESEKLVGFIVGLPVHTNGDESQKSLEARAFGNWLNQETGLPIHFFDERYTSAFANQILATGGMTQKKKKKRLDMIAAQIMLTAYIESGSTNSELGLD